MSAVAFLSSNLPARPGTITGWRPRSFSAALRGGVSTCPATEPTRASTEACDTLADGMTSAPAIFR
jgi:hypothetical protein